MALGFQLLAAATNPLLTGRPTGGVFVQCGWGDCGAYPATAQAREALTAGTTHLITHVNGQPLPLGRAGELAGIALLDRREGANNVLRRSDGSEVVVRAGPAQLDGVYDPHGWLKHLVALAILALGALVWLRRPEDPASTPLLLFASLLSVGLAWLSQDKTLPGRALVELRFCAQVLYAPAFLELGLRFPAGTLPPWARAARLSVVGLALLKGALLLTVRSSAWVVEPRAQALVAPLVLSYGVEFLTVLIFCLAAARRAARDSAVELERQRARTFALACAVALVPPVVRLLGEPWLPGPVVEVLLGVETVGVAGFLGILAHAIIRHRLFDLRLFLRQSAVYTLLTLFLSLVYVGVVLLALELTGKQPLSPWQSGLLVGALVLAASVLKVRVQQVVDKLVYRQRALYARALREASDTLARTRSLDGVRSIVHRAFVEAMQLEDAQLLVRQDHPEEPQPDAVSLGERAGVASVVPLTSATQQPPLGWLLLGAKRSGRPFTAEDQELISTLANQLSIGVDNAIAFDEIRRLKEGLEETVAQRTQQLQQAQAQLVDQEKRVAVERLVAGLVHELNSPLGALKSASQGIPRGLDKLETNREPARTARTLGALRSMSDAITIGVDRVSELVRGLKSFVALDRAETRTFDARDSVRSALGVLRHRIDEGITVRQELDPEPLLVHCDMAGFNQVLVNLIDNALKAMPQHGTLKLQAKRVETRINVCICDDGIGIDPARIEQLFELNLARKEGRIGMGLGLPHARRFLSQAGGSIELQSAPAAGTTVQLWLPTTASERVPNADASNLTQSPVVHGEAGRGRGN